MIKISRLSSPLKDKVKNLETCSQLDGDGVFEGKYNTSGSILIRNMFIVWLFTGIWHGAEWTFVIWGILNFVFLIIERFIMFEKIENHNFIKNIYALFVVNFGWVLFRSPNLKEAYKNSVNSSPSPRPSALQ